MKYRVYEGVVRQTITRLSKIKFRIPVGIPVPPPEEIIDDCNLEEINSTIQTDSSFVGPLKHLSDCVVTGYTFEAWGD